MSGSFLEQPTWHQPSNCFGFCANNDGKLITQNVGGTTRNNHNDDRLLTLEDKKKKQEVLVPTVDSVGYHVWMNNHQSLLVYVLGKKPTLRLVDVASGKETVLASNIGRGMASMGGTVSHQTYRIDAPVCQSGAQARRRICRADRARNG